MDLFTVDNFADLERNYKILLYFILIPCAKWWIDAIYKVIGFLFGSRD